MEYYSRILGPAGRVISTSSDGYTTEWSAKAAHKEGLRKFQEREHRQWKTPSDNESFSEIKKSGAIKMTPYSVGKELITNKLVSVHGNFLEPDDIYGLEIVWWNKGGTPMASPAYQSREITIQGDLQAFKDMNLPYYKLKMDDVSNRINDALSDAVSDLASQYDMLTDIGELASTLAMMNSIYSKLRHPIQSWHDFQLKARRQHKGEKLNEILTNRWMEFRYGIMPLVYSAQDVYELVQKRTEAYKTSRKTVNNTANDVGRRDMSKMHIFENGAYVQTHRVTAKARYSSSGGRVISQIGFNPFVTAWELVPLSFVVDWFINIGDYIEAQTSSIAGAFTDYNICISTKTSSAISTSLHVPEKSNQTCMVLPNTNYKFCVKTGFSGGGGVLQQSTVDTYDRILVNPSDVKLSISPSISLMRAIDSYSLTSRPLIKRLRTFK